MYIFLLKHFFISQKNAQKRQTDIYLFGVFLVENILQSVIKKYIIKKVYYAQKEAVRMNNMFFDEKLMLEKINSYGIKADCIPLYTECDLTNENSYKKSVICALDDCICTIDEDGGFFCEKYENIDDIYAKNFVSSGAVFILCKGEEIPLGYFTMTVSSAIEGFISAVCKKIDGGELKVQNLKESDFSYINQGRKKLFLRVMSYIPRYKKHLFMMIGIIILSTLINMLRPYITGTLLYDEVLSPNGKYSGRIFELVAMLVIISSLSVVLGIFQGRIGADMSGKIIFDIKTEVFSSMQKLGMSFFSSKRTGNLLNRVNSDALDIQYFLNDGLPNFIINGATICSVGLFLFIVNPLLSVTVLIPIPLIVLIIKKSARVFKKLKWHSWRRSSSMNSVINDSLEGVRVVKAFGKENREIERFSKANRALGESRMREGFASARVFPVLSAIMTLGGLFVWGIGGGQVMYGKLSFGELMSFVGYLSLLYAPVNFMVKTFDWFTSCMNSAQRIFEVIDRKTDVPESEHPVEIEKIQGDVELRNVNFSYEPNRMILKNVSFKVNKGEMIGLVGHSGAGKSTITNIITRLYDVSDGEVLIDGINVKDIKSSTLRSSIGMVLQETYLFSGSVAQNIAYGRPCATQEEIMEAAKLAHAHEFIMNLPDGYETQIGRKGIDLSGGEKQRISIARAILMNPSILIFDEATSSLDTKTEKQIQDAMKTLVKGRTTIAIAHRFSTLKNADRLVVVENGCIVENGTHEELFSKENGVYANMAKKQMEALNMYD